jgi:hypothetical protein
MDKAELIDRAAPACHECGKPIQRVEIPWYLDHLGDWRPGTSYMVCGNGHRVEVKLLS